MLIRPSPPTFHADFNALRPGGRLIVSTAFMEPNLREPQPGDHVVVYDSEENTCEGYIEALHTPIIELRMDMTTWRDGDAIELTAELAFGTLASFAKYATSGNQDLSSTFAVEETAFAA